MEGIKAPDFSLTGHDGKTYVLKDFQGKWVVFYFYPKADTPGCTKETCGFRDLNAQFAKKNAVILGISADDVKPQSAFAEKFNVKFPLLCDPDHKAIKAYKVWGKKQFAGKENEGIIRSTFLIDPKGTVAKEWRNVKVDGHMEEVFASIA